MVNPSERVGPTRTCAGCRKKDAKDVLLRFVTDGRGSVRLDARQRLSGRGVYLCSKLGCIERGLRGAVARGLRVKRVAVDPTRLVDRVVETLTQAAEQLTNSALADGRARLHQHGDEHGDGAVTFAAGHQISVVITDGRCLAQLLRLRQQIETLGRGWTANAFAQPSRQEPHRSRQGGTEGECPDI